MVLYMQLFLWLVLWLCIPCNEAWTLPPSPLSFMKGFAFPQGPTQLKKVIVACSMASLLSISPVVASVQDADALSRLTKVRQELVQLDQNWDQVVQGQGDNIRRVLGTVYTPPKCERALCGFTPYLEKFVQSHLDDLDLSEFEEPLIEAQESLNQADFLAYSSMFSEYGNGGGGQDYIQSSHAQVLRAIKAVDGLLTFVR